MAPGQHTLLLLLLLLLATWLSTLRLLLPGGAHSWRAQAPRHWLWAALLLLLPPEGPGLPLAAGSAGWARA
jgi:hypothetical protein